MGLGWSYIGVLSLISSRVFKCLQMDLTVPEHTFSFVGVHTFP